VDTVYRISKKEQRSIIHGPNCISIFIKIIEWMIAQQSIPVHMHMRDARMVPAAARGCRWYQEPQR
jgi:hypothetical protein